MRCTKTNDKENKKPVVHQYLSRVKDWLCLIDANKVTKDIDDQIEYTWGDLIEYGSKSKTLFKFIQENPEIVHILYCHDIK